jgi:phosphoribosyl 1,2-cyclic phosphodiesterase
LAAAFVAGVPDPRPRARFGEDRIVKICVLASSSAGNSTFVGAGNTRVLIDAGLSRKEICQRLAGIGEDAAALSAVLITHEHSDHTCGLLPLLKKFGVPVYVSRLTAPAIPWGEYTPKLETFQAGERITIGELEIDTFTVPHDAIDPVGFCVRAEGVKIGFVTDLGYMPDSVRFHLHGAQLVVLESNHDIDMLKVGPYPWSVKQRVMGRNGHLSNDGVCGFIRDGLDGSVHTLVLGHLSEHNNHPEIVRLMAVQALQRRGLGTRLCVAEPRQQSEVFQY